jgi:NAD(P)-dependent dehydrogenase (short-subunit alcohol dehydrogenase family)
VDAITGVLAKEFGPRKIRVNSINPGIVETEGTHTHGIMGSDFETHAVAQTPLGRVGQPGDGGCGGVPGVERFAVVGWGGARDFGGDAVAAYQPEVA